MISLHHVSSYTCETLLKSKAAISSSSHVNKVIILFQKCRENEPLMFFNLNGWLLWGDFTTFVSRVAGIACGWGFMQGPTR